MILRRYTWYIDSALSKSFNTKGVIDPADSVICFLDHSVAAIGAFIELCYLGKYGTHRETCDTTYHFEVIQFANHTRAVELKSYALEQYLACILDSGNDNWVDETDRLHSLMLDERSLEPVWYREEGILASTVAQMMVEDYRVAIHVIEEALKEYAAYGLEVLWDYAYAMEQELKKKNVSSGSCQRSDTEGL